MLGASPRLRGARLGRSFISGAAAHSRPLGRPAPKPGIYFQFIERDRPIPQLERFRELALPTQGLPTAG